MSGSLLEVGARALALGETPQLHVGGGGAALGAEQEHVLEVGVEGADAGVLVLVALAQVAGAEVIHVQRQLLHVVAVHEQHRVFVVRRVQVVRHRVRAGLVQLLVIVGGMIRAIII